MGMQYIIGLVILVGGGVYLLDALSDLPPGSGWVGLVVVGLFVLAAMEQTSNH